MFTSENNDIANQSIDTSFFTSEKNRMTNQLASLARRDYFYLDVFWRVNLGMYIIKEFISRCSRNAFPARAPKKNEMWVKWVEWSVLLSTTSMRHRSFPKHCFRISYFFVMFLKGKSHLHSAARTLSSSSFQLSSTNLDKDFFRYL